MAKPEPEPDKPISLALTAKGHAALADDDKKIVITGNGGNGR